MKFKDKRLTMLIFADDIVLLGSNENSGGFPIRLSGLKPRARNFRRIPNFEFEAFMNIYLDGKLYFSRLNTLCGLHSSERYFSCLKRIIKNYLRSTMSEKRLNNLTILSIESYTLEAISFDTVI